MGHSHFPVDQDISRDDYWIPRDFKSQSEVLFHCHLLQCFLVHSAVDMQSNGQYLCSQNPPINDTPPPPPPPLRDHMGEKVGV